MEKRLSAIVRELVADQRSHRALAVFLQLYLAADPSGVAYLDQGALSRLVDLSERQLREELTELEARQLVVRGRSKYQILDGTGVPLPGGTGVPVGTGVPGTLPLFADPPAAEQVAKSLTDTHFSASEPAVEGEATSSSPTSDFSEPFSTTLSIDCSTTTSIALNTKSSTRARGRPRSTPETDPVRGEVEQVVGYANHVFGTSKDPLQRDRFQVVKRALGWFSVDELLLALTAASRDPWWRQNYPDALNVLRKQPTIERLRDKAKAPQPLDRKSAALAFDPTARYDDELGETF